MDRRTGSLVRRLRPGDIAVIDHLDLDRANAESLVDCGVVAVVNASPFISGRYPNLGPGPARPVGRDDGRRRRRPTSSARLKDGSNVRLHDGAGARRRPRGRRRPRARRGRDRVADGGRAHRADDRSCRASRTTRPSSSDASRSCCCTAGGFPALETELEGRPVVVVVRGYDYREDLRGLQRLHPRPAPGPDRRRRGCRRPRRRRVTSRTSSWSARRASAQGDSRRGAGPRRRVGPRLARRPRGGAARRRSGRAAGGDRLSRLGVRLPDAGRVRHQRGRRAPALPTSGARA